MTEAVDDVQFWFDPICPWAWITSRWIREVENVRPVKTYWRLMSLAYLNLTQHEGSGLSEEYVERMTRAWGPIRVCAAAAAEGGEGILGDLYTAIGTRYHVEGRRDEIAPPGLRPGWDRRRHAGDQCPWQRFLRARGHPRPEGGGGRQALGRIRAHSGDRWGFRDKADPGPPALLRVTVRDAALRCRGLSAN
jgi:hypothetical protein